MLAATVLVSVLALKVKETLPEVPSGKPLSKKLASFAFGSCLEQMTCP